jgi:putative acetyltransferase
MKNNISIRSYNETDAAALAAIYFNTIHNINSKDYSSEQVDAWAPRSSLETEGWRRKWKKLQPLVATINDKIVGFAELEENGYIDCFYCHHEYQGHGVGSALMREIENRARKNKLDKLFAEVSITAKPFFEAKGFTVKKQQSVIIRGVEFINFVMEKIVIN